MVLSLNFMNRKELLIGAVLASVLMALVILPGILAVNLMTHELYHMISMKTVAKSVCIDINTKPYVAHVDLTFQNSTDMRAFVERQQNSNEYRAEVLGNIASIGYVVFAIVSVLLICWMMAVSVRPERLHKKIVSHIRKKLRKHKK